MDKSSEYWTSREPEANSAKVYNVVLKLDKHLVTRHETILSTDPRVFEFGRYNC
jgi:hypothetical protein